MTMKTLFTTFAALCLIAVVALMTMIDTRPSVYAAPSNAPLWAITPVGVENPITGGVGNIVPMVTAAVTADGRVCKDMREWTQYDIQTVVEWASTPDTITLKLEHSNDNTNYVDGPVLVSTVVANTDALNRYDNYGAFTCVSYDIANPSATNYANVKVLALPKK
jgi:hypothetical protein